MMMDPAVKTALAACVLLAGYCAATLLRNNPPAAAPPGPAAEQLSIRGRAQAPTAAMRPRRERRTSCQPVPQDANRPPTVVTPSDRREAPPPLAQDYPQTDGPASVRSERTDRDLSARTHKVVDGDTLPALAHRYLGSASRASEIFAANHDVLHDPELLPIGVELKIPPRRAKSESAPPSGPLVPVPHPG
jgi:nucleoid-associated protein YgaU